MAVNSTYNVIISDKAKRMLGTHIRFMAQVNKQAAATKKKEIMDNAVYVEYILDCRTEYSWLLD